MFFFLIPNSARDDTHIRLGYLDLVRVVLTCLTMIFMVHQNRHVHKFQAGEQVQKGLPYIQDGNLAATTYVEPFFRYFYHFNTSL